MVFKNAINLFKPNNAWKREISWYKISSRKHIGCKPTTLIKISEKIYSDYNHKTLICILGAYLPT